MSSGLKRKEEPSSGSGSSGKKGSGKREPNGGDIEEDDGLVFEDPFGDEFEEEEFDEEAIEKEAANYGDEEDEGNEMDEQDDGEGEEGVKQVWRPGVDRLEDGETLDYDPSAYIMYHALSTEWPCLSFDIMRDTLGDGRQRFPHSLMLVAGSQADSSDKNKLTILKLTDLHKTGGFNVEEGEEDEDDDHIDEDPTIEHINIPHNGGVNRVRCLPQNPGIIASMADNGSAYIYNAQACLKPLLEGTGSRHASNVPTRPMYTFKGHKDEGYALNWSTVEEGLLATGDCAGNIHVWNKGSNPNCTDWKVDSLPYTGHNGSVEDLQWSPREKTVFASAGVDGAVKIWDTRGRSGPQISVEAHKEDVNVISWSSEVEYLLASGCDDGSFKVWDLRSIRSKEPLANFTYHRKPVTAIEWAPHDESVLCVSSADDQVTIWDLSVEADESQAGEALPAEFPPQLLFIHQGQKNVKEVHWHPQIPNTVVSTSEDGFNVLQPAISVA